MKPNALTYLKTLFLSLQSGKSVGEALKILEELPESGPERSAHAKIRRDVQRGESFSEAFGRHMDAPRDIVLFIGMAEKGGSFRGMLEKVLRYVEMKEKFHHESSDKIGLPLLYFFLSCLIVLFVRFYAIPNHIAESLQYDPQIQQLIADHLRIAEGMGNVLFAGLLLSAAYFLIVITALFSQRGFWQGIARALALAMPVSSKILGQFEKFVLFTLIGEMLKSGIPFRRAIQSGGESTDVERYRRGFQQIEERIVRGERQWWSGELFDEVERRLLMGTGSMTQVGDVLLQLADRARMSALLQSNRFFRIVSVLSIVLMAFAVFVEFFTVVLTQVLIQKGIINAVDGARHGL